MGSFTLLEFAQVPVRHWHTIGIRGDPVPQRLHVRDLLVDGKVVEVRWRRASLVSHDRESYHSVSMSSRDAHRCTGCADLLAAARRA